MKIALGIAVVWSSLASSAAADAQVARPAVVPANKAPGSTQIRPSVAATPTAAPTGDALQETRAGAAAKLARLPVGPHIVFGTIVALAPTTLELKLRGGRVVTVSTAFAIASDNYSAPLFVGKIVTIDGRVGANGKLTATHIYRLERLDSLPADS